MKNIYLLFLFIILICFTPHNMDAQSHVTNAFAKANIEGLAVYPNPVSKEKPFINIASKRSLIKNIEIFDVLGKRIFTTVLPGKELNVSNFKKGVYILRITENSISESRKLVIK